MCLEIIQRHKCACIRCPTTVEECPRRKPDQAPGTCDFAYTYRHEELGYMCGPCLADAAVACAKIVEEVKRNLVDIDPERKSNLVDLYPERKGRESANKNPSKSPALLGALIDDWF